MRTGKSRWLRPLAVLALGLTGVAGGCATAPAPATATAPNDNAVASVNPQQRWSPDHLIQQNQLLPNGLRPFRYFYW